MEIEGWMMSSIAMISVALMAIGFAIYVKIEEDKEERLQKEHIS